MGKIDSLLDKQLFENRERRFLRNGIKKLCNKYVTLKPFLEMYLKIQGETLDEIYDNKYKASLSEKNLLKAFLLGRMFELNLEFIGNMKKEFYHSANALTRQMIEVYAISGLLNHDLKYGEPLIDRNSLIKIPRFKEIWKTLEANKIFPKFGEGIKTDHFFDSVRKDYSLFSGIFHPKQDSFDNNLWVFDLDNNYKLVNGRPYKEKGEKSDVVILFPARTPFHFQDLEKMIHSFYQYNGFALDEIKKLAFTT